MSLIGHSPGKAYLVLDTHICWISPNLNHFDLRWTKILTWNSSCTCILDLYNKDKEKVLISTRYSLGGKIWKGPSTTVHPERACMLAREGGHFFLFWISFNISWWSPFRTIGDGAVTEEIKGCAPGARLSPCKHGRGRGSTFGIWISFKI